MKTAAPLIESEMDFDDTPIRTNSYKEIFENLKSTKVAVPETDGDNPFLNPFGDFES